MCSRPIGIEGIALLLCTIAVLGSRATTLARPQRNVVLIVFDDLRPAIGAYGDRLAQTPHLDAFINGSYYFKHAYSQQALCAPSRNSFLTSRRPDTLRLYDFYNYWRLSSGNFTTLPQYFKSQGYHTYSVGKIFHPGVSSNNSDDYPHSWSTRPFHPRTERFMNSPVCPDRFGILRKNLICPVRLQTQPHKTLPDIETVNEAIRYLESRKATPRPFFLAVGFHKPHINFRFPEEYLKRFRLRQFLNYTAYAAKPPQMPEVAWNPFTDVRSRDDFKGSNISFPYGPISRLQSAQIRQAYYASVSYVDELFGRLVRHIDLEHTVVLATSDHGWSLGEHGEWAKYSNFEVALRVPLIIRSPDLPLAQGAHPISAPTELLDIFPTLVDLAHVPPLPQCRTSGESICCEGKSLYSLLLDAESAASNRVALSQYPRPGALPTKQPSSDKPKLKNIQIMGYSLRSQHFRYTLWVHFNNRNFSKDWSSVYGEEMYDHRFDADEQVNLAEWPQFQEMRLQLRDQLMQAFAK